MLLCSSTHHFRNPLETLVSRRMPLNKHIHRERSSTCHMLTNTRGDRNVKNFAYQMEPQWGTTGVDVHYNITGCGPRLSSIRYSCITNHFQWLMSIRDVSGKEALSRNAVEEKKKKIRPEFAGCFWSRISRAGSEIRNRLLPRYVCHYRSEPWAWEKGAFARAPQHGWSVMQL